MMYPKTIQFPTCVVVKNPPALGEEFERNFVLFYTKEKSWTEFLEKVDRNK